MTRQFKNSYVNADYIELPWNIFDFTKSFKCLSRFLMRPSNALNFFSLRFFLEITLKTSSFLWQLLQMCMQTKKKPYRVFCCCVVFIEMSNGIKFLPILLLLWLKIYILKTNKKKKLVNFFFSSFSGSIVKNYSTFWSDVVAKIPIYQRWTLAYF